MTITRNFNLHLNAGASIPLLISANQYDSGEEWVFTLYSDRGVKYTPASGAIIGLKSDGHAIANNATVNGSGQIVVTETEQMTASVGKNVFELSIDSGTHGTANFIVLVEPQPYDESTASDSDLSLFEEAIEAASNIKPYGSPLVASTVAGMTDHDKVYVYTGSETGYTSGHWYYWDGTAWADGGVYNSVAVQTDTTLTLSGVAADSKKVGDELTDLKEQIESSSGLTTDIKDALLQLAQKVAYIDANGQDYYDDLHDALYPPIPATAISLSANSISWTTTGQAQQLTATVTPSDTTDTVTWLSSDTSVATVSNSGLVTGVALGNATITATAGSVSATCSVVIAQATLSSISAVYTQSGTVFTSDSLDSLKSDLVVTAHWSNNTTSTVADEDYTLSGTLTAGTSTITVSYDGKTTTFNVTVTAFVPSGYTQYDWIKSKTVRAGLVQTKHIILKTYSDLSALSAEVWYKKNGSTESSGSVVFGGRATSDTSTCMAFYAKDTTLNMFAHGTDMSFAQTTSSTAINHVVYTNTASSPSSYYANSNSPSSIVWTNTNTIENCAIAVASNLIKGANSKLSSGIAVGNIKLYDLSGNLVSWYVPVVRDSDNLMGMYEVVDQIFYTASDTTVVENGSSSAYFEVGNWS